MSLIFEI